MYFLSLSPLMWFQVEAVLAKGQLALGKISSAPSTPRSEATRAPHGAGTRAGGRHDMDAGVKIHTASLQLFHDVRDRL